MRCDHNFYEGKSMGQYYRWYFSQRNSVKKFAATDKKYELKTFIMVNELLDNLLLTFIVIMLLVEFFLLVRVLTIFQVAFDLFRDYLIQLL